MVSRLRLDSFGDLETSVLYFLFFVSWTDTNVINYKWEGFAAVLLPALIPPADVVSSQQKKRTHRHKMRKPSTYR